MVDSSSEVDIHDLEKNREFFFNLVYKFYDNQITQSESTNTFLGFIIAANGVILLGLMTLTFSNDIIFLKESWLIRLAITINLLFACLSIWLCLAFIIRSQPIPFSITKTPLQLINQKYSELHTDAYNALNQIINANTEKYSKEMKFLVGALLSFGLSLVLVIVVFGIYFAMVK